MRVYSLYLAQVLRVLSACILEPYACEVSSPQWAGLHAALTPTRGSHVRQIRERHISGMGAFHEGLK